MNAKEKSAPSNPSPGMEGKSYFFGSIAILLPGSHISFHPTPF